MCGGSGIRRKKFRGVQGYDRPRSPEAGEFSKIWEKFLKKILIILVYFSQKFQNPALNFRTVGRKTQLFGKALRRL